MKAYWVTFKDGNAGCVEADNPDTAKTIATEVVGSAPVNAAVIPWPANPRLNQASTIPSMCYTPAECMGMTGCPKSRACSE
jgi:hypothetical protein